MQILVFLSSPIWFISKAFFLLGTLSRNEMPDAIQSTIAVDFSHTQPTRADNIGLLNLPLLKTASFGKISIRYNALLSWNFIQPLLPAKISDFEDIKSDLKNALQPRISYIPFPLSTWTLYHSVYVWAVLCVMYCLSCDRPSAAIGLR